MSIPIIGLSSNYFVPGTYVQVQFGAGESAGTVNPIRILLMGNKTSSGSALCDGYVYGPDVEGFTCATETDVKALFGPGSELHRAYRRISAVNSVNPVYFLPVTSSVGSSASLSVTIATTAAANGFARLYVEDEFVDTSIVTGDTANAIAVAIAASVNSKTHWGVTATAPGAGVVTLTAKTPGLRGNKIRVACKINGSGVATTSSASNFAYLSGGTTADSWTAALATALPLNFRYIVASAEDSAGNLLSLSQQITTQALPLNNIRQRVVVGNVDSAGTVNAFTQALNNARVEVVWQPNSNLTPFNLAACAAAGYTLGESQTIPVLNFDHMGVSPTLPGFFNVKAPFDGTKVSVSAQQSALVSGVTPVAVAQNGSSYVVSRITSYSIDPATVTFDPRVRDGHIVTVMDMAADLIQSTLSQQFSNKVIGDNPQPGQQPPGSQVVTPDIVKATVNKIISNMGADGLLQKVSTSIGLTQVQRETSPDSRMSALVQLYPVSLAHQFGVFLAQLSYVG